MSSSLFQDTYPALQDCVTALEGLSAALRRGEWEKELPSSAETVAFRLMKGLCERYLNLVEEIDSLRQCRYEHQELVKSSVRKG